MARTGLSLLLLTFMLTQGSGAARLGVEAGDDDTLDRAPTRAEAQAAVAEDLAASGHPADALAAYIEAINLTPPGADPPGGLLARASELRHELLGTLAAARAATTLPTDADASADEAGYYKLIAEGDAARRAGKLPDALRAYQRAQRFHHDHKLKLPTRELDEKLAYTRELQQKQPAAPTRGGLPQKTQPQKRQSTRATTGPG